MMDFLYVRLFFLNEATCYYLRYTIQMIPSKFETKYRATTVRLDDEILLVWNKHMGKLVRALGMERSGTGCRLPVIGE
jgi:hypothetical protein